MRLSCLFARVTIQIFFSLLFQTKLVSYRSFDFGDIMSFVLQLHGISSVRRSRTIEKIQENLYCFFVFFRSFYVDLSLVSVIRT